VTADSPGIQTFVTDTAPHIRNTKLKGVFLLPATQLAIGFDWTRSFIDSWISGVRIAIAGEFNYLSNLQQIPKTLAGPIPAMRFGKATSRDIGNIYMYGANFRLGADF